MRILIFTILLFFSANKAYAQNNLDISAQAACLTDILTGKIIYEYNGDTKMPMASTTKIMTAIVALENGNLSDEFTVSKNAARQEGSSAYLSPGEKISLSDALYGLMLNSGNDAAVVIAEGISGSEESFATLMNDKAKELGALNTNFSNSNGLDSQNHYTTANDLAKISAYAIKNDEFRKIVGQKTHKAQNSAGTLYFLNHNKLLNSYNGCIGIKTGYTKKSGRCLVSAAQRGNISLVCVTLNDPNDWEDHKNLLDMGFDKAEEKNIVKKGDIFKEIKTDDGKTVAASAAEDYSYFVWEKDNTEIISHTIDKINASIDIGEKIGYLDIISNNKVIKQIDLVSSKAYIKKLSLKEKLLALIVKTKKY